MNRLDQISSWFRRTRSEEPAPEQKKVPEKPHRDPYVSHKKGRHPVELHKGVLRVIPIGGLEEVGKNCMIVEHERDILIIDMGFQFPEEEMLGVDYVIPDIQYLVQHRQRIRGILITHGHLDHIGALPYVIADLGFPTIYGSPLSIGLVKKQLDEHKLTKHCKTKVVDNKHTYEFGSLTADFFRVNHSIPDSLGVAIRSPQGTIVHTGDFKFDFTPADGVPADIEKMAELGRRGVQLMFSDSTNALKPGHTLSERVIAENLEKAIGSVEGRIIIACFSSLLGRVQQILDFAHAHNKYVFLSGGSMISNVRIAQELGVIRPPKGVLKEIKSIKDYPDDKIVVLTTGSQGEPIAALSRMATKAHAHIQIKKGDTVVFSSSPIIGNEKPVAFVTDQLARLGAEIVHNQIMDVHTSGHGNQEDLKLMMTLIKPEHFVPVHGNFYMRRAHGDLGPKAGIVEKNVHMLDNGNIIEVRNKQVSFKHEDIGVRYVVIDGLGQGDLGSAVQKERELMAQNGMVNIVLKMQKGRLIGKPIVSSSGFLYQKELEKILLEIEKCARDSVNKLQARNPKAHAQDYEQFVRSEVSGLIVRQLDRRPLIKASVLHI